jgi:hypothetical protein
MFHTSQDNKDILYLRYLINQRKHELEEKENSIRLFDSTEETTRETEKTIREAKGVCIGGLSLNLFYNISEALHLDPQKKFPSRIIEAEAANKSARSKLQRLRADTLREITFIKKQIRRADDMLRCAGASPGNIDYELYKVLKKYADLDIDITVDEGMGIALAKLYREKADEAEVMRIATRGRFALREVGNCAADVVFDPPLRQQLAERKKQVGYWGRHTVMREYLKIATNSPDHSTVKAYLIESRRLRDLPEHILYGLVVCGEHHAMRILKVERDGLRLVEGNVGGQLSVGRYIPFSEVALKSGEIVVYSRQPAEREGLHKEFSPYDYTNEDAVGYETVQELLEDVKSPNAAFFKLKSEKRFTRLPLRLRDSMEILRFIPGKSYDITCYADLVDGTGTLFPGCSRDKVIYAFLREALRNPCGKIVALTVTSREANPRLLSRFTRQVPERLARQMFVYFNEEGGEEVSLSQLKEITEPVLREHGDMVPRIILLAPEEFMAVEEPARRNLAILTPRRDEDGREVDTHSHFEQQLMRAGKDATNSMVEDESGQVVTLQELMQNPLQALIILEQPFALLGICTRLTADELAIFDRYPVIGSEEKIKKLIARKYELRKQYLQ